MKTVFIYALKCPVTGRIRYVGKSTNPAKRFRAHLRDKELCWRTNWIRALQSVGKRPALEILDEVLESEWPQWEVAYIEYFLEQGCDLVNSTAGGKGGQNPSKETRAKMSAAQKELRARIPHPRLGKKGGKPWNLGIKTGMKPWNLGIKTGIKPWNLGMTGIKSSPEALEKLSIAKFGKKHIDNVSGFAGVCWDIRDKKYRAYCTMRGVRRDLGYFSKIEDAVFVRSLAVAVYCSRL